MSLLLKKSGILTTIQDLGRHEFRRFGINPNGVMDTAAARLINILLGNDENEGVFEMHFPAPLIVFEANALFATGGGDFTSTLDDRRVENWQTFFAKKGSVLKFAGKRSGNRSYLAVKGGFKIPEWLGSSSTNLAAKIGGFEGRKLESGDRITFKEKIKRHRTNMNLRISAGLIPHYSSFPTIRVIAGAEFGYLSEKGRKLFLEQDITISKDSNRMGFRLTGQPIALAKPQELISSAVNFGTIQLLPDGQLIILMADQQTSGGYPRIAHVITHDLPLLAQVGTNDKVAFHLVAVEEAEKLAFAYEKELNFLRVGCKFQSIP